ALRSLAQTQRHAGSNAWRTRPAPAKNSKKREGPLSIADVLHLFLKLEAELFTNAAFEFGDQRAQLGRRAAAGIVNDVGMVRGDLDAALAHAFGADLLQKERRGDLAASHGG